MDDKSFKAMLHVHGALLASLCATSPSPADLLQAFDFHLQQVHEALGSSSEVLAMVNVWAATYRRHIPATAEPDPPG